MFVFANLLDAVATVLNLVLTVYLWLIIARAVVSWVNADPYNTIVRLLCGVTDPVLALLRRNFPMYVGNADLSPIVVIVVIIFLQRFLVTSLYDLARTLQ